MKSGAGKKDLKKEKKGAKGTVAEKVKDKKVKRVEKKVEKKEEKKVDATKVVKPKEKKVVKAAVTKPVNAEKPKKEKKVAKKEGEATKPKRTKKKITKSSKHQASGAQMKRWRLRNVTRILEAAISEQFLLGRLFAKVSTSPGQSGTADGYVLEGEELSFYVKRMAHKKKK